MTGFAAGLSVDIFAALGIEWKSNSMALRCLGILITILVLEAPLLVVCLFFWLLKIRDKPSKQ